MAARGSIAHFIGCLLGGGVADALGAPVEFLSLQQIRARYGLQGIADYDHAYGRRGAITDDTQMTLFTAEGVLRAVARWHDRGICHAPTVLHHAYIRWLHTQGERSRSPLLKDELDGWLIGVKTLHARRAPGNTCLSALRRATMGTMDQPLNDSKGCGRRDARGADRTGGQGRGGGLHTGCEAAATTHGHPSGYYAAGCLAAIIRNLIEGRALPDAIDRTLRILERAEHARHEECAAAIRNALALWCDADVAPSPEAIERLGGGWVGEEALAISLYCALTAPDDFERAVRLEHCRPDAGRGGDSGEVAGRARAP